MRIKTSPEIWILLAGTISSGDFSVPLQKGAVRGLPAAGTVGSGFCFAMRGSYGMMRKVRTL